MLGNSIKESIKNQFLLEISKAKYNKTESEIREAFKDLFLKMKGSSASTKTFAAEYVGCKGMQRFLFDVFCFGFIQNVKSVGRIDQGYWQEAIAKIGSKELVTVDDIRDLYVSNGMFVPITLSKSKKHSKIVDHIEEPLRNLTSTSSLSLLSTAAAAIENGNSSHHEQVSSGSDSNLNSRNTSMLSSSSNTEASKFYNDKKEQQNNSRRKVASSNRSSEENSSKSKLPIQNPLRLFTSRQKAVINFLSPLLNKPSLSKNKKDMDMWNSEEVLAFLDEINVDISTKSKFKKYSFVDGAFLRLIVDQPEIYSEKFFSEQLQLDELEKMKIIKALKLQCEKEASKSIASADVGNNRSKKRTLSSIIADLKHDQKTGRNYNNKRRKTKK